MKTRLAVCAALMAGMVLLAEPAGADPKKNVFTVNCGQGAFAATANGNGDWTPAHVTDNRLVYHPVAFGEFTGTFTPSDGGPPQVESDPPVSRSNLPKNNKATFDCTFHIDFSGPEGTFVGDGSATLWAS